jgi:hypothetical protein
LANSKSLQDILTLEGFIKGKLSINWLINTIILLLLLFWAIEKTGVN